MAVFQNLGGSCPIWFLNLSRFLLDSIMKVFLVMKVSFLIFFFLFR